MDGKKNFTLNIESDALVSTYLSDKGGDLHARYGWRIYADSYTNKIYFQKGTENLFAIDGTIFV